MESITLPEATSHTPTYAVAERRARSHEKPPRERFAPLWLRASLALATLATLGILFPRSYIEANLQRHSAPDAATLTYLRLMVMAQPAAIDTRILLAQQALAAGDISLSRYALAPWMNRGFAAVPLSIALLHLHVLRADLFVQRPTSRLHAELAGAYTRDVLLLAPRMEASDLLREARFVAELGQYTAAARLYMRVIAQAGNARLRLEAFHSGIQALLATGRPLDALAFAQGELAFISPSTELWREMTQLALRADAPKLAARYARRLIGLERP